MALDDDDSIDIPAEAIKYIESVYGPTPFKYEIIEGFFSWLRLKDPSYIYRFLKRALNE